MIPAVDQLTGLWWEAEGRCQLGIGDWWGLRRNAPVISYVLDVLRVGKDIFLCLHFLFFFFFPSLLNFSRQFLLNLFLLRTLFIY